jgi:hypothetical protein
LQPVGDSAHRDVATQSRRLGPILPPPFQTQVPEAEIWQSREPQSDTIAQDRFAVALGGLKSLFSMSFCTER